MSSKPLDGFSELFHRVHVQALNTDVELLLWVAPQDCPIVERISLDWLHSAEARFSRHNPDSELSLLNSLAGERCLVSDVMLEVLSLAEAYRQATQGAYNPLSAGAITIDSEARSIRLPQEAKLDLEYIVQCWIAQRLGNFFQHRMKLKQGLIRAGNFLKVWGRPFRRFDPWMIGIQDPWRKKAEIGSLALPEGAAATYAASRQGGSSAAVQCTVAGLDVVDCGIWAKVICELGVERGFSMFSQNTSHDEALLISAEGQVHFFGNTDSLSARWREIKIDHYH